MKTLAVYENDKLFSTICVIGSGADESGALYTMGRGQSSSYAPPVNQGSWLVAAFQTPYILFQILRSTTALCAAVP